MSSIHRQPLRSQAKAVARREEERVKRFHRLLAISVMTALTLGAILLAKAETWVVVNEDGTVTRCETRSQAQVSSGSTTTGQPRAASSAYIPGASTITGQPRSTSDTMRAYDNALRSVPQASTAYQTGNTTFFAGNYYPVPTYSYSYPTPGGVTYPVGPVYPNVPPPMVTTLPSTAYGFGFGYPAYPVPAYPVPCYPQVGYGFTPYPYPYASTGIFYSGPAGGGGTIYSSTTTSNNGFGLTIGKGGARLNLGNTTSSTTSSTTITTVGSR